MSFMARIVVTLSLLSFLLCCHAGNITMCKSHASKSKLRKSGSSDDDSSNKTKTNKSERNESDKSNKHTDDR